MAARLELALACSLQPATQPCQALMITLLLLLRGKSASAGARTASWSEQILQLARLLLEGHQWPLRCRPASLRCVRGGARPAC